MLYAFNAFFIFTSFREIPFKQFIQNGARVTSSLWRWLIYQLRKQMVLTRKLQLNRHDVGSLL